MRKTFVSLISLTAAIIIGFSSYIYLSEKLLLTGVFVSGICFGVFLMYIKLNVNSKTLNSYKRELEKESIASDESYAKVKVLENKITVLEKALENALKKG